MLSTAGYEKLYSGEYISSWVKLFNALYGTTHTTISQVYGDVTELLDERVYTAQAGLLTMAFNVTQLIIGVLYLHSCPLAPMLPVCLVVAGAAKIARDMLATVRVRSHHRQMRGEKSPLLKCTTSSLYTLVLWLFWVFIYAWLVVCAYYLFDTIADVMRTAEHQSASQNIRAHGGFQFPPGMRTTVYVRDDAHDPERRRATTTTVLAPGNRCSNTLLLSAFFLVSFRLAVLFLNVFMGLAVTLCGILAICGAEADDLIVSTVPPDLVDPTDVEATAAAAAADT